MLQTQRGVKYGKQMEYDLKMRDLKLEEKQKELDQALRERDDFKIALSRSSFHLLIHSLFRYCWTKWVVTLLVYRAKVSTCRLHKSWTCEEWVDTRWLSLIPILNSLRSFKQPYKPCSLRIRDRFTKNFGMQNPHSFDNAAAPKDAENQISQLEEILMFKDKRSESGRHGRQEMLLRGAGLDSSEDGKKDTAAIELPGISSIRDVEYVIEFASEQILLQKLISLIYSLSCSVCQEEGRVLSNFPRLNYDPVNSISYEESAGRSNAAFHTTYGFINSCDLPMLLIDLMRTRGPSSHCLQILRQRENCMPSFQCKVVEGFLRLALPLTKLTERMRSCMDRRARKIFEELKQRLISTPILTLPSDSDGFQIFRNAFLIRALIIILTSKIAKIFQQEIVAIHGTRQRLSSDRITFHVLYSGNAQHTRQEGYTNKLSRPLKLSAKLSCFLESIAYEWRQTFWYYRQDLFHQTIRNSRSRREISYRLAYLLSYHTFMMYCHVFVQKYKYHSFPQFVSYSARSDSCGLISPL
ncbi:hypothetical protein Tco_0595954 [Tanacetum coccineum]